MSKKVECNHFEVQSDNAERKSLRSSMGNTKDRCKKVPSVQISKVARKRYPKEKETLKKASPEEKEKLKL